MPSAKLNFKDEADQLKQQRIVKSDSGFSRQGRLVFKGEHADERNRKHHDESGQRTGKSNVEKRAARRHHGLHSDERAEGSRQQSRRLRNEKRKRGVHSVITAEQIVPRLVGRKNCQQ